MKAVKLTLMLLSFFALMTACDESNDPPPGRSFAEELPQEFNMRADATCTNPGLCDGSSLQVFSGDSASCSMVNSVCYDLDGEIRNLIDDGDFQIHNGKIHIYCTATNSSISGTLHGNGYMNDSDFIIGGTIILNEKTECFANVTDILFLKMEGQFLFNDKLHYVLRVTDNYEGS